MKRLILYTMLSVCIILLAACKPTPDEPFVVNKNDGKLETVIYGDPAEPKKYDAPETWNEDITAVEEGGTIKIAANITIPPVERFPVYRVDSPAAIDQAYADRLLNYFAGNEKLYKNEAPVMTKNDIMKEIMKIESEIMTRIPTLIPKKKNK